MRLQQLSGKFMDNAGAGKQARKKISFGSRHFHLPESRAARIAIGIGLIVGGILGFLPILGFWMIPLGLFVLSQEFGWIRRARRRFQVWLERRARRKRMLP